MFRIGSSGRRVALRVIETDADAEKIIVLLGELVGMKRKKTDGQTSKRETRGEGGRSPLVYNSVNSPWFP